MGRARAFVVVPCALIASSLIGTAASSQVEPSTVRFSAVGDISSSTNAGGVLDTIAGLEGDLTLALGDLSYGVTG